MAAGDTLRRIAPLDQWIINAAGHLVGIKNPNANGNDLRADAPLAYLPYLLAQTAVPVVLPASGSSNATGQITHGTALPYTPAGVVQVYLPAGVVVGDAVGGLYPAIYANATTCQLVGSPATANGAYTQSTSEVALATISVPGGAMGANGSVRCSGLWSMASNANAKTARVKFAGTIYYAASPASSLSLAQIVHVRNRSVSAQVGPATNMTGGIGSSNANPVQSSADTTLAQVVTATGQLAVATDYLILDGFTVELMPAP